MNRAEKRRRMKRQKAAVQATGAPETGKSSTPTALSLQDKIKLGLQYHAASRLAEAEACYQEVLRENKDHPDALHFLGVAAYQKGDAALAVTLIRKALDVKPDYVAAFNNLGNALRAMGRLEEAMDAFRQALALNPNYGDALTNLGNALKELDRFDEAVAFYEKALVLSPDSPQTLNNLGNALKGLGHHARALTAFRRALEIVPDFAEALHNLGLVLRDLGRVSDAEDALRKALAIKPSYANAHMALSHMTTHVEYDDDIRRMEAAYSATRQGSDERGHLASGLGKAFEDLKEYDRAFPFFLETNKTIRGKYEYSPTEHVDQFAQLKAAFSASLFCQWDGLGCQDETPIFILGMPRSGTSLVEQILASHPQVHGAGELGAMMQVFRDFTQKHNGEIARNDLAGVKDSAYREMGESYIRLLRAHCPDSRFVTDKMPDNFKYIGLIKLILPKAKVVHCRRDPVDTCLSIFKANFGSLHKYAHDLEELGRYYNLYRDLMRHWESVLPGYIYSVQYEDMVSDQEAQTRALLSHLGLPWDDACLEFHKTRRTVSTASVTQVRRPIYKDSVRLWKRYGDHLAPLLKVLG